MHGSKVLLRAFLLISVMWLIGQPIFAASTHSNAFVDDRLQSFEKQIQQSQDKFEQDRERIISLTEQVKDNDKNIDKLEENIHNLDIKIMGVLSFNLALMTAVVGFIFYYKVRHVEPSHIKNTIDEWLTKEGKAHIEEHIAKTTSIPPFKEASSAATNSPPDDSAPPTKDHTEKEVIKQRNWLVYKKIR